MGMLEGKVAIVTGAGGGLGRAHALLLAAEGAKVVVNDLGGARDGTGASTSMADGVVDEIKAAGGEATAHYDDMWDVVMDVHLRGTYLTTKVAFDRMLEQGTGGRIIMTSSTSGLLGNFGQTNYGAAKAGIAGFMRCLWLEGVKYGITVNVLAPTATSRLTTDILPEEVQDSFPPEAVSPPVVWLCTDEAKDISGRQWLVAGNNVSLLSWQVTPIAQASADAEPWAVADIGEKILASKEDWPPVNPLRGG